MSHDPDHEFSVLQRDPVVSGEVPRPPARKYGDDRDTYELMLQCVGKVDALGAKFDDLREVVEKRAPMPPEAVKDMRSIKHAAWVLACGVLAFVLYSFVSKPAVPVRAAQLPLSAMSVPQ